MSLNFFYTLQIFKILVIMLGKKNKILVIKIIDNGDDANSTNEW
jgi:hypothetical protein